MTPTDALEKAKRFTWQPMETAPKGDGGQYTSGPRILIYDPDICKEPLIGFYDHFHKDWLSENMDEAGLLFFAEPSAWMPLPDPPVKGK